MLTYQPEAGLVKVFADGKHIGDIKQEVAPPDHDLQYMWRYWPKGHGKKWAVDAFPSIHAVKATLE